MSSNRTHTPSTGTNVTDRERTLKHSDAFSTWRTVAVDPRDKKHKIIKDQDSGQLCRERPHTKRRFRRNEPPDSNDPMRGGLPSVPEDTHVRPSSSSQARREGYGSHVTGPPTTADHRPPDSRERPSSRQPSSNRSRRVAGMFEEPSTEAGRTQEGQEQGREEGGVDVVEEGNEEPEDEDLETLVVEAKVQLVSVEVRPPSGSKEPSPSPIHRRETSQSFARPPTPPVGEAGRSSSTDLPPITQSNSQDSYSPSQVHPANSDVEPRMASLQCITMKSSGEDQIQPTKLATEAPMELKTNSPQKSQNLEPAQSSKPLDSARDKRGDDRLLNEVVVELDSDPGPPEQYVVEVTEPLKSRGDKSSRSASRQPSLAPSRPSRPSSLRPPHAESSHQRQASSMLHSAHSDPQQSQMLDDTMAKYSGASPPAWYVRPETENRRSDDRTGRHLSQQPEGYRYPLTVDVPLAPSDGPRSRVPEDSRFNKGTPYPPSPPSQAYRSLSQAPQQGSTHTQPHQATADDIRYNTPRPPYPIRPESRRGHRRPTSSAGPAYVAVQTPSASGRAPLASEPSLHARWPRPSEYRRRSPLSDSERPLHLSMGASVDNRSQAYPMPPKDARDQRPPSRPETRSQAQSLSGGSRRRPNTVVLPDDPLAGDGSDSSSSVSSAALEAHVSKSGPNERQDSHPGAVVNGLPKSRIASSSRGPPPSIYVIPADTPSPPSQSRARTEAYPPASLMDGQSTLLPTKKDKSPSLRSAQKQVPSQETQQTAFKHPEGSQRRWNVPSQTRQASQVPLDPDRQGLGPSLKRLGVPGGKPALPGLSRVGSSGSLREQAHAAKLNSSGGEDNQSTSGYFTERENGRTSDYSDDSDDTFDNRRHGHPPPQRTGPPPAARDPHSQQNRHVDDVRHLAAGAQSARLAPRQVVETRMSTPGPPPQQRPVDGAPISKHGSKERGRRRSRSRSRMPGNFPGDA